jgi:tetratricopeptide (TPR) repeat protein
LDEAVRHYESAIEVFGDKGDPEQMSQKASILLSLGIIHSTVGELDTALKEIDEVLALSKKCKDRTLEARAHFLRGKILEQRTDIQGAFDQFKMALDIFKQTPDVVGQAMAVQCLGMCHFRKGEYPQALEMLRRSQKLAEEGRSLAEMTTNATLVAGVLSEMGDVELSEENYKKAEELAVKDGDPYKIARIYNNWGDLRMREFRYEDAIPILKKALEPCKRSGNLRLSGFAYGNIGECLVHLGDLATARPNIERAKAIFERLDDKLQRSRMIMIEGVIYRKARQWDAARICARESISQAEAIKMPFTVGEYLLEFGITCKEQGELDEARLVFERAMGIFKEIGAAKFLEKTEEELRALDGKEGPEGPD